jgi:acid phosphatase (class A)
MKRFIRHFNEQKDIDSLKYDKVKEKPTPLLKGEDWKNINVPEPPRNSSPEVKSELSMIKELGSNRTQKDINSIKEHDMVATYAIRDYLEENDLLYDTEDITKIVKTGAGVSRFYKNKFQRIRPWQLAEELGMEINQMDFPSDSMQTPSYPSGHSLQSRLVAEYYIKKYPEHRKGLIAAAEECGQGRVKAGWHFPSDHDVGVLIATEIAPMVKL